MRLPTLSSVFCILLGITAADSAACDDVCASQVGSAFETSQHAAPDFNFYQSPDNFHQNLTPGSVLRIEKVTDLTNYSVPTGLTMSRLIYTTTNLNGTVLPTTAYILWPYAVANEKEGYSMVAWAHGTSGVLRGCAPSNYRALQYHFMVPFLLAFQGHVVVAPDYAGLGINASSNGEHIGHPWGSGPAQANDLANAIIAARKAFPEQLKPQGRFVAMGHSQGGQTAWSFAERLVHQPISGYRGTVSLAPPSNLIQQVQLGLGEVILSQPLLVSGVTAAFPAYNYSGLTSLGYHLWNDVLKPTVACIPTNALVFGDTPWNTTVKANWTADPTVQKYSRMATTGRKRFVGPLLVLAGEADMVVPLEVINSTVHDTCDLMKHSHWKESLEMVIYPGMDHFPVIQASSANWLPWINNRLSHNGANVHSGCKQSTASAYRTEDTFKSTTPNWLVSWVPTNLAWEYLL